MARQINAYPLTFKPIAQERLWGGNLLPSIFHMKEQENIGEIWTLSDHPTQSSICSNGPLAGESLTSILATYPKEYLGDAWTKKANETHPRFPLLIKFLHANDDLSVQIHPDDAYGIEHEQDFGKTEAWYVLQAEAGAKINYGHHFTNRAEYDQAVQEGRVKEYLSYQEVKEGDFIFVPSRTLHALLKGTMVLEIQQTSDVTYRVYDWDRLDDQGNARQLHIEQAAQVMQYGKGVSPTPEKEIISSSKQILHERLVQSDYFDIEKISLKKISLGRTSLEKTSLQEEASYDLTLGHTGNPDVIVVIEGDGKLLYKESGASTSTENEHEMLLQQGDTILIPSTIEAYTLKGRFSCLRTFY